MVLGAAWGIGAPEGWKDPGMAGVLVGYGLAVYALRARGRVARWFVPFGLLLSYAAAAEATGWSARRLGAVQGAAMSLAFAAVFLRWVT
jgi:hypothetical protein